MLLRIIVFSFIVLFAIKVNGQVDSFHLTQLDSIIVKQTDSICSVKKAEGVSELIGLSLLGYEKKGYVLWKDGEKVKGICLLYNDNKVMQKKIPPKKLRKLSAIIFSDKCNFSYILSDRKRVYISHDFVVFMTRKTKEEDNEPIYFTYSNYLNHKEEVCLQFIKQLF